MDNQVSGKYLKRFYDAMLPAFPDYNEYKRFLRLNLHIRLDDIVSSEKMGDVHFEVLEWFERDGRLDELLTQAIEARPTNEELKALVDSHTPRTSPVMEDGGARIGEYQVERILGNGRVSIVYQATDNLGRRLAIKVLDRLFLTNGDFREKFDQEAKIVAQLEHEAIVPIYQYGEYDDNVYMVMPYMAGGSLRNRLNEGLSLADIVQVFQRIGPAVDYVHRKGIVHQNIKPENILFDSEGLAYLGDFDTACLVESCPAETQLSDPHYLSPEQFPLEHPPQADMDVYALGVILYESLAGEPPFQAYHRRQMHSMHAHEPVPDIIGVRPDLPAGLQTIIEKAMAKDPAGRFTSAGDLAQALENVLEGVDEPTVMRTEGQPGMNGKVLPTVIKEWVANFPLNGEIDLDGPQTKQFSESLRDAYPGYDELEQMLFFQLNRKLEDIVLGDNLPTVVFNLIQTARAEGWLADLINAAREGNPGNQQLATFVDQLLTVPSGSLTTVVELNSAFQELVPA